MGGNNGNAVVWKKSSASAMTNCVEVAFASADHVLVRDSKAPAGAVLEFSRPEWEAFLVGVRSGEFDAG